MKYDTIVEIPLSNSPRGAQHKETAAMLLLLFALAALLLACALGLPTPAPAQQLHVAPGSHAPWTTLVSADQAVDKGRDAVQRGSEKVKGAARDTDNVVHRCLSTLNKQRKRVWDAVRDIGHSVDDALPDVLKNPVVVIPAAAVLGQYAASQGWLDNVLEASEDAVDGARNAVVDAYHYAADRARAAVDFVMDRPILSASIAGAAIAVPTVVDSLRQADHDTVHRTADAVKDKVGQAKAKADAANAKVQKF